MSICAVLCGAKSYIEMPDWCVALTQKQLKTFRAYYDRSANKFTPPSEPTIRRVLQNADAAAIDRALNKWMYENNFIDDGIAVDGKVSRGAKDEEGKQLNLLCAFMHTQGVVIGQQKIGNKTNEIPEIKNLLSPLNIEGKVVTADALHTQVETAKFIVEDKKADYVFTVKDNQPTLNADIEALELERFSPRCPNNRKRAWTD